MALAAHPVDLSADVDTVAGAIDAACRDTGFLVLVGHGVAQRVVDAWVDGCTAFFDRPMADKAPLRRRAARGEPRLHAPGQGSARLHARDGDPARPLRGDDLRPRRRRRPDLRRQPPLLLAQRVAGRAAGSARCVPRLRRPSCALGGRCRAARDGPGARVLPDEWLVERCADSVITTRAINYERQAGAPEPEPGQMRLGAHTDYGVLTLLWADDVPGLQVRRQGTWHDVSVAPGTLLGNIGDLLAMWTNDRWHSTLHRVLPPPVGADGAVRRRSCARFLDGDPSLLGRVHPVVLQRRQPGALRPRRRRRVAPHQDRRRPHPRGRRAPHKSLAVGSAA